MKKILISLSMGMSVRNLLHVGFLEELAKSYEIILATSFYKDPVLLAALKEKNLKVRLEPLYVPRIRARLSRYYYQLAYIAHWNIKKPIQLKKNTEKMKAAAPLKFFFQDLLARFYFTVIRRNKSFDWVRDLCFRIDLNKVYGPFDELYVASTDQNIDQIYTYSAARAGIPVINLVHSWDNVTARGYFITDQVRLQVWNEDMKRKAVEYQGIPEANIQVVGVPQFSAYEKITAGKSKVDLARRFGFSENCKVVTYCCSAYRVAPDEETLVEWLVGAIQKEFGDTAVLILRLHPEERQDKYIQKYKSHPFVKISYPDMSFKAKYVHALSDAKGVEEFALIMKFSDVVLNLASTTALDAICLGTPSIGVAFNMTEVPAFLSARRHYYESSHYSDILKFDAIPLAESKEHLMELIRTVLKDRDFKKPQRQNLHSAFSPTAHEDLWNV
jgi:hypothetical protein